MKAPLVRLLSSLAAIGVLLASFALGGSGPASAATASQATGTATDRDHVRAINDARASAGLSPLRRCGSLGRAAHAQAKSMARAGVLGHSGSDGSTPGSRARSAGYSNDRVGENVAVGYPDIAQVIEAWLASPGHRANLLNVRYQHVGVATAAAPDGRVYWAQVFGSSGRCR